MSIYNPFMPTTSFLARATLGGGGGDGDSGGGDSSPPATISGSFTSDKAAADATTAAANEQYGGGYQTATTFSDGKQGYSTIQTSASGGGDDRPAPAPVAAPPAVRPEPPVQLEPRPVDPLPEALPPVAAAPAAPTPFTPPPPPTLPDRIPETTLEDAIIIDVTKPTYGDKGPQGPMGDKGATGATGEVGDKGATGATGEVGDKGATGATGEVGDKGATGTKGLMGRPGERGQAGRPGAPGAAGTYSTPLQTAGMSAVPDQIITRPNYTGTTMANITLPSQGQQTVGNVMYGNDLGQTILITEVNGQPSTYVPPGFRRMSERTQATPAQSRPQMTLQPFSQSSAPGISGALGAGIGQAASRIMGFNEGGSVEEDRGVDAMYRMATQFLGYRGPKTRKGLEEFAKSSPGAASKMRAYLTGMAKGGLVSQSVVKGYQEGGLVPGQLTESQLAGMSGNLMTQTFQPVQATTAMIRPEAQDFVAPTAGQTAPQAPMAEVATTGTVEQAQAPQVMTPANIQAVVAAPQVSAESARLQAAQGQVSQQAQVQAAQQAGSAVTGLQAAQGTAILMDNPVQRQIQDGELITGAADAAKAASFAEQVQAAEATPSKQATVQGQLEGLMNQFEGGATPSWAAGAMRAATATMAARGLGASSLAGQALIQAAMESALPIAAADAQTVAQFEVQNLSNRQQRAMLAAQQRAAFIGQEFDQNFQTRVANASRIADVANMNFTAEQQVALENSRIANTTNLQNLNNRQAKVMAEAAALANLDISNLNNRQQAAVQNAQNFLQMDLTNLNNEQQTGLFRAQQNIQALFTDQAAQNAALQFNAASENQTNQFFSNLDAQVSQFNATQQNAMDQFNVNSVNAMRQFNSEVQQQRDLFNAQNGLVVAQANAQWRQNIATLNTAAMNQSNMDFAKTVNALTSTNLDQIWQRERDIMSYSFTQSETAKDRALNILLADKDLAAYREKMASDESNAMWAVGTKLLFGI